MFLYFPYWEIYGTSLLLSVLVSLLLCGGRKLKYVQSQPEFDFAGFILPGQAGQRPAKQTYADPHDPNYQTLHAVNDLGLSETMPDHSPHKKPKMMQQGPGAKNMAKRPGAVIVPNKGGKIPYPPKKQAPAIIKHVNAFDPNYQTMHDIGNQLFGQPERVPPPKQTEGKAPVQKVVDPFDPNYQTMQAMDEQRMFGKPETVPKLNHPPRIIPKHNIKNIIEGRKVVGQPHVMPKGGQVAPVPRKLGKVADAFDPNYQTMHNMSNDYLFGHPEQVPAGRAPEKFANAFEPKYQTMFNVDDQKHFGNPEPVPKYKFGERIY